MAVGRFDKVHNNTIRRPDVNQFIAPMQQMKQQEDVEYGRMEDYSNKLGQAKATANQYTIGAIEEAESNIQDMTETLLKEGVTSGVVDRAKKAYIQLNQELPRINAKSAAINNAQSQLNLMEQNPDLIFDGEGWGSKEERQLRMSEMFSDPESFDKDPTYLSGMPSVESRSRLMKSGAQAGEMLKKYAKVNSKEEFNKLTEDDRFLEIARDSGIKSYEDFNDAMKGIMEGTPETQEGVNFIENMSKTYGINMNNEDIKGTFVNSMYTSALSGDENRLVKNDMWAFKEKERLSKANEKVDIPPTLLATWNKAGTTIKSKYDGDIMAFYKDKAPKEYERLFNERVKDTEFYNVDPADLQDMTGVQDQFVMSLATEVPGIELPTGLDKENNIKHFVEKLEGAKTQVEIENIANEYGAPISNDATTFNPDLKLTKKKLLASAESILNSFKVTGATTEELLDPTGSLITSQQNPSGYTVPSDYQDTFRQQLTASLVDTSKEGFKELAKSAGLDKGDWDVVKDAINGEGDYDKGNINYFQGGFGQEAMIEIKPKAGSTAEIVRIPYDDTTASVNQSTRADNIKDWAAASSSSTIMDADFKNKFSDKVGKKSPSGKEIGSINLGGTDFAVRNSLSTDRDGKPNVIMDNIDEETKNKIETTLHSLMMGMGPSVYMKNKGSIKYDSKNKKITLPLHQLYMLQQGLSGDADIKSSDKGLFSNIVTNNMSKANLVKAAESNLNANN